MTQEIIVDTRELEAPEPMSAVLNEIYKLDENTSIKMIHRIEPLMLYNYLLDNDINYKVVWQEDEVSIYIWNNSFIEQNKFKDTL